MSSIFGLTAPNINNGVVNSYGVETSVRWADKIGDFNYQIGGMLTFNRNKIINQNEEYRPHDYLETYRQSVWGSSSVMKWKVFTRVRKRLTTAVLNKTFQMFVRVI